MRDERGLPEIEIDKEDAWLDAAIESYASAQPRDGLEGRVLARVTGEARSPRTVFGWRVGFAAAGVLVVLVCVALVLTRPAANHRTRAIASLASESSRPRVPAAVPRPAPATRIATAPLAPRRRPRAVSVAVKSQPFRNIPPSPEERLLLRLASLPGKPLPRTDMAAPVTIPPIEISRITLDPVTTTPLDN